MKKIVFLLTPLLLLTSCGFSENQDFSSVLDRHTTAQIEEIDRLATTLGLSESRSDNGMLRLMADIPTIGSGRVETTYHAISHGSRAGQIDLSGSLIEYHSPEGSGSLSIDSLSFLNRMGESFLRVSGMSGSALDPVIAPVLTRYAGQWIDLSELQSGTGGEAVADTVSKNLSTLTIEEMKGYAKKYPLWKLVRENGVIDGYHSYEVELDQAQTKALIGELSTRLSEKSLDPEDEKSLDSLLSGVSLSGTLRIQTKNEVYGGFRGTISGSGRSMDLSYEYAEKGLTFALGDTTQQTTGSIGYDRDSHTFSLALDSLTDGISIGSLSGSVVFESREEYRSYLRMTAQGISVSLSHEKQQDGFSGSLTMPEGSLVWGGTSRDDRLTSLTLSGNTLGAEISADLSSSGSRVTGPLSVTFDAQPVFSAQVSMEVSHGLFSLMMDILSPMTPGLTSRLSIDMTHEKKDLKSGSIDRPTPVVPYSEILRAIEQGSLTEVGSGALTE